MYPVAGVTSDLGEILLYGGTGYAGGNTAGPLNDLWKFNGVNWVWTAGTDVLRDKGVRTQKRMISKLNNPAGLYGAVGWVGRDNSLYLFAGQATDVTGDGAINNLWKFSP